MKPLAEYADRPLSERLKALAQPSAPLTPRLFESSNLILRISMKTPPGHIIGEVIKRLGLDPEESAMKDHLAVATELYMDAQKAGALEPPTDSYYESILGQGVSIFSGLLEDHYGIMVEDLNSRTHQYGAFLLQNAGPVGLQAAS